jgi:hypothetical protein
MIIIMAVIHDDAHTSAASQSLSLSHLPYFSHIYLSRLEAVVPALIGMDAGTGWMKKNEA